jgi:hypothetical protein
MKKGRAKPGTVRTAWLAVGGTVAFVVALALSLLTGCGPPPRGAVVLRVERHQQTPRDASVIIDEQYVGPLSVVAARGVKLPVGEHRVSVEKSGYFPYDELVTADRDEIRLEVKLDRVPD